jgi:signal transduction histidine kinase/ActR/RegA family two-component response regulator
LLILAGLDPTATFTPLLKANRDSLALIVGSSVLALMMTTVLGARLIRRPINQLTEIAERWKAGDLSARTGLAGAPDEFGRLALSFETMAAALAAREAALQEMTNNLEGRVRDEVAAREIAQNRAAQAERMHALGQLAGGVAHDINNVLHAISGAITLIERRIGDQSGIRRLIRIANEAVERGISVTRRLLTFGRRGDLQAQTIDVSMLLRNIREILTYTLGVNIATKIVVNNDVGSLTADRGQLETVLVNLATNARDAMPEGGELVIAAEPETVRSGAMDAILGLAPGHYVRLSVTDTGTGMSAETLSRARDPFFTTKPAGMGTGLGLAMAHGFAQQSGGALDLKSQLGKGTTVTLWLPAAEAGCAGPTVETDSVVATPGEPGMAARILLVDDEATIREVFAEHLQEAGHEVLTAREGAEALTTINEDRDIDILITDLSMPGMDGLSLIRAAHLRRPELPAILITGYAGSDTTLALSSFISDTVSLLRKPVSATTLLDQVDSVLAVRRSFTSFAPAGRA